MLRRKISFKTSAGVLDGAMRPEFEVRSGVETDERLKNVFYEACASEGANPGVLASYYTLFGDMVVSALDVVPGGCGASARIANYQILDAYKTSGAAFSGLEAAVKFCVGRAFKFVFFVHRKGESELRAYHDKHKTDPKHYTQSELYRSFELNRGYLFVNGPNGKRYYIYGKKLSQTADWTPVGENFVKLTHDGEIL